MYNYVKYNDIMISDIATVLKIEDTLLPARIINTINIFEKRGEIFDSSKYESKEKVLTILVEGIDLEDYEDNVRSILQAFDVDMPKSFYKEEDKFCYAITSDKITKDIINQLSCILKVTLYIPEPVYYTEIAKVFEGNKEVECLNEGSYECYPIINIGFDNEAQFVQVENTANNKKILAGTLPSLGLPEKEEKTDVIVDACENISGWTEGTNSVDSGRSTDGTLALTEDGKGIMVGTYGSGSTIWKGVGARKSLGQNITDFYIEATLEHNSTGINGDPTVGNNATHKEEIKTGGRTKYYQATGTTNVRTGPSTKYKKVGTLKNGDKVTPISVSKSWIKFKYNGTDRYVSKKYMKVKYKDNTTTITTKNFVTTSSTALRTSYNKTSKQKCSIPGGTTVRLISSKQYLDPSDKKKKRHYYKLAEKYKGYTGYVAVTQVIEASDTYYEYDEELETADDKTAAIEIYGYSVNNEKIFRLGLYDDDAHWEFTYPLIQIGSKDFLKDKTIAPKPRTETSLNASDDKLTIKKDTLLSGQYGDWNDFYGKIGIQRQGKKWLAWVYKYESGKLVKRLLSNETTVNNSPSQALSYIVLYIGTQDINKPSGAALYNLEVKNLNPTTEEETNILKFNQGDVLKLDCYNNTVYLNDKEFSDLDIGSQFFELEQGENIIKVRSDDEEISTDVIFNERWLI
ncbi:SH3 domain-containing protein [Terrisporobacter sp.]|uniref:SH3 domain-containing protein n=1 Tax=Terrisporobacter sp. TaxID=1965305 RepID=UPI0028A0081C|nr:SH3 domain-containing protein [Terrisporobacter sp.]